MTLPDRSEYPDYYEIIKRPLALTEIRNKLEERGYTKLDDMRQDCETMCNNAKRYNQSGSVIWTLAKRLHVSDDQGGHSCANSTVDARAS